MEVFLIVDYLNTFTKDGRAFFGSYPILLNKAVCPISYGGGKAPLPNEDPIDPFHLIGMSIDVRYSSLSGPCNGGHSCNAAKFYLYANNILLGLVNLNNGGDGGDRNTSFTLTDEFAEAIDDGTGILKLQLVCATPPDEDLGWGMGQCHSSVPWVYIVNGKDQLIFNSCPSENIFTVPLLDGENIYGCTDSTAANYNPLANVDDGSCEAPAIVYGCTDPYATNYDPNATEDDGSCVY